MAVFQEIPPKSQKVLTVCEFAKPAGQPRAQPLDTYHPMWAMSMAGVAEEDGVSRPAHRGPEPSKGILRAEQDGAQPGSSSSTPSPKSPRFAHLTTVHGESSPREETQCITRTLRPPGPQPKPKPTAASTSARSAPKNKGAALASAGLNQLFKGGPTADEYTGTSASQAQGNWAADVAPPLSPSSGPASPPPDKPSSGSDSPPPDKSLFALLGKRPATPPRESDPVESPKVIHLESWEDFPDPFESRGAGPPSESHPGSPATEAQLPGGNTVAGGAETEPVELPPPYPATAPLAEGPFPETASALTTQEAYALASAQASAKAYAQAYALAAEEKSAEASAPALSPSPRPSQASAEESAVTSALALSPSPRPSQASAQASAVAFLVGSSASPSSASPQPSQASAEESALASAVGSSPSRSSSSPQPTQTSVPPGPPLRVIMTPRKGRGISASKEILSGEIIVRENPLIDELHDLMRGGKRRIRES